jgi:DNA replication and repair protein RecF
MHVDKIRVQHIRTHADFQTTLSPRVTIITGSNGAGKTSLIEALHIALTGSSFKGVDKDILHRDESWYRIDVGFSDGSTRIVKFNPSADTGRKQFVVNGKTQYRLSAQHKYPIVLFEPDDLRLLGGSPTRRRQFIDRFIGQVDPQYGIAVRRYERALKQRNALLKRHNASDDDLFAWNVSLSEYGAYIIKQRLYFIDQLHQQLNDVYTVIAKTSDLVGVRYSTGTHGNVQQKLLSDLHASTNKDKALGFTSTGPHRHDVLFDFNGSLALDVASRGEIRSIILALKFLEVRITQDLTGKKPIILLDDVFSELDEARQKNLVTEFTDHQIVVTSVTSPKIKNSTIVDLT